MRFWATRLARLCRPAYWYRGFPLKFTWTSTLGRGYLEVNTRRLLEVNPSLSLLSLRWRGVEIGLNPGLTWRADPRPTSVPAMRKPPHRVMFYIDGFNLYYGALKGQPHRWLDLEAFCERYIKAGFELVAVKYFTAKVEDRPDKPGQRRDQREYLRALQTLPKVEIIYGHFLTRTATRLLEHLPKKRRKGDIGLRSVWIQEEKGSDVNLASHLLADGFRARYDLAVVISNDSDLKMPVEIVRSELDAGVGIINPHEYRSWALSPRKLPARSFYQRINPRHLRRSQLSLDLVDEEGPITCPDGWTDP